MCDAGERRSYISNDDITSDCLDRTTFHSSAMFRMQIKQRFMSAGKHYGPLFVLFCLNKLFFQSSLFFFFLFRLLFILLGFFLCYSPLLLFPSRIYPIIIIIFLSLLFVLVLSFVYMIISSSSSYSFLHVILFITSAVFPSRQWG